MTNNSIKVLVLGLIALLLTYFNKAYSILIMLVLILIYVVNAYQLEKHYQRMGRFLQRERDNELKEVEIENKYHEKILSQLIRSMNLPMLFVDKEGKIAFTNQSFRKGFEIPHLKGRYYKDIFVGEMLDLVEQCYVFERPLSTVVKIQSRYYQVESSPVFSDHEKLIFDGTIVLFTDVSKMKEIEDMQKQFLSDVSHELKTPISVAYAANDVLLNYSSEKNESRRKDYLYIIKEQLQHLSGLVEQILSMSRDEQKEISLKIESINLRSLCRQLISEYRLKTEKPTEFTLAITDSFSINADRIHFYNILSNLIDNSLKYSGPSVHISISAKKENKKTIIEVIDNGNGIKKEQQERIFDKFYRVPTGNIHDIKGYGLGLYYIKRLIETHNGKITVISEYGKGSKFIIEWTL